MGHSSRTLLFVALAPLAPLAPLAGQQIVARTPAAVATGLNVAVAGDFDGDLDVDVIGVAALLPVQQHRLLRNDGAERFTDVAATHLPPLPFGFYSPRDAVAFDKDNDGDLDVCVGLQFENWLWENDGTGHFTNVSSQLPWVAYGFRRVVAADLDGDGDRDLATIPDTLGASVQIVVNQGTGTFTYGIGWPTFSTPVNALTVADVDGDGDGDVLAVGALGLHVWRNDGGLAFTDVTSTWTAAVAASNASAVVAGDLDGDGDPDVVLGGNTGTADVVLRNTGSAFTPIATLPAAAGAARRAVLVDVDDDGDLDFVRGQDAGIAIALNDGLGSLALAPARVGPTAGSNAALLAGDFDRDGDVDLVASGHQSPAELLVNRHRDLRPGQPAIGQPWDVEVWSAPGYASTTHHAHLAIGLAALPAPVTLGPLGELWLDLGAPLVLFSAGVPASTGLAPFALAIPNAPPLVGLPLHLQALVDPAPALPHLTAYFRAAIQ